MTPDGATVVTASKDCTARVWDAATGACLHVLEGKPSIGSGGPGHACLSPPTPTPRHLLPLCTAARAACSGAATACLHLLPVVCCGVISGL
jgi:hypothetical protein